MLGKGWFAIYAVLLFFSIYMFISQQQTNGEVKQLREEIATLKDESGTAPSDGATAEPSASPAPSAEAEDLATPAGRDAKRKRDVALLRKALAQYGEDNKTYPTTLAQLIPQYLESVPTDPQADKTPYRYRKTGGSAYTLTVKIESQDDASDEGDGKKDGLLTVVAKP